jgi:hypothetical protein
LKRLSFAASAAATFILVTNSTPSFAIGIDTTTSPLAGEIARSARGVASSMGSVGYCFRGVKRALKRVGFTLVGGEAYMAKEQLADNPQFEQVPLKDLHIGDVLVHGASARHPHGHIAVYLGDGREASDHLGRLITGARYGGTTVWRVKPEAPEAPEVAVQPAESLDHSYDVDAMNNAEANADAAAEAVATPTEVSEQPATDDGNLPVADAEQPQTAPVVATVPTVPTVINVPSITSAQPHQIDITNTISSAMMQVVQMAQSAQINLTQALADAVGALTS